MKSCFFIGHRDTPDSVTPKLIETIERLIEEEKVAYFYVGGYGNFDRLAGLSVKRLKEKHPNITLMLVLPYHPAERAIIPSDGFDGTYYPDGLESVPKRYAIVRANKRMIETSDWLVTYVCHPASNARNLLEYANRRETAGLIQIENLAGGQYER